MSRRHPGSFTEVQLPALVQKCQRPHAKIPASACPFCTEWEVLLRQKNSTRESLDPSSVLVVEAREFSKHVAFHMEELALFALPVRYDDSGSNEGRSDRVPSNQADMQDSSVSRGTHYASLRFALPEAVNLTTDQDGDGDCLDNETPVLYDFRNTADRMRDASRQRNTLQNPAVSSNEDCQPLRRPSADSAPLLLAAEQNKESEDLSLLMQRAGPEGNHSTALHLAAALGNMETVDLLLANGADIESRDKDGRTPLLIAMSNRQYGVAQVLVVHGADVDARDDLDDDTALHFAVKQGHLQTVNLLLEARASLEARVSHGTMFAGSTPLHKAIWSGHLVVVDELLLRGADFYAKVSFDITVLHWAVYSGHDSILQRLLAKATPDFIEAKNRFGETALYLAVGFKFLSTIAILLDAGSTVDTADCNGKPLLHNTISLGSEKSFIQTVLAKESAAETRRRPVHMKEPASLMEVFRFLLGKGVNIEAKDNDGRTLLHLAAIERKLDILQLLLQSGAKIDAKDNDGKTPLHCAGRYGSASEIIDELVKNGAKLNERDDDGNTPLHSAVMSKDAEVFECLLRVGTDLTVRNNEGQSVEDMLEAKADGELMGLREILPRYKTSSVPQVPEEKASVAGEEAGGPFER